MQDLEDRLKELGNSLSRQAPSELRPTARALHRIRVGRAVRSGAVLATVAALVVGAFAGARSLTSGDAAPVRPADRSSRIGSLITIAEGGGEVRSAAVMEGHGELLFPGTGDLPGDHLLSVHVSASEEDGEVFGSGSIQGGGLDDSFTIRCSRQVGVTSLALGGIFDEGQRAGKDIALVIKDLDRDRLAIWFGGEDGCDSMLDGIELRGWEDLVYEPVRNGNFTLPDEE